MISFPASLAAYHSLSAVLRETLFCLVLFHDIDTRRHFIGELVAAGTVKLADCRTDEMVADALTKSLPYPSFKKHQGA